MLIIYTDGACFGNPGPMGIGVVVYKDGKKVLEISEYAGEGTNNIAEYLALIRALETAKKIGEKEVHIKTDSQLLACQINGEYKVKNAKLKPLKAKVDGLMFGMKVKVEHVEREKNEEADELSKRAVSL
ncbi:ribonuclease HI family protein [Candidatus Micrarchaeota archaeon]|nr:ribonuclease HI family protein [Candidatus Micrarchaeota archaeon]